MWKRKEEKYFGLKGKAGFFKVFLSIITIKDNSRENIVGEG